MAPAKKAAKAQATARKPAARRAAAPPAETPEDAGDAVEGFDFVTPPPAPSAAPPAWSAAAAGRPPMQPEAERQYAMLLHLSALAGFLTGGLGFIVGPLVLWLVKKDESAFVDRHGRAAVDFWISMAIYIVGAVVLFLVLAIATLGLGALLLLPFLVIGGLAALVLALVLPLLAGLKAQRGEEHRYPLSFRFLGSPPPQPPPGTTLI